MAEHRLIVTFAGFRCRCGDWKIGSWNGAHEAFATHAAATDTERGG